MSDVREASLIHSPDHLPGGAVLQAGPYFILLLAGLWLQRHFDELPARIPIHWNWRGDADSWVPRTPVGAALPLIFGVALVTMLLLMQAGMRRAAPRGPMRKPSLWIVLVAEYFVALLCCGVLAASATSGRLLWPVLVGAFAGVLVLLVVTVLVVRGVPREPLRNPGAWKAGLFYVDREDPALFVPKRYGVGYTFNFGNPWALLFTFVTLVVPLLIGLYVLTVR
ncbi:MAG: DUF5808 domain-containing protein [Myxococcales bacterium]